MASLILVIQIPCYNEEQFLPVTLRSLPKSLAGISRILVMVVDDGSSDQTVSVAREFGVEHIVELHVHRGLARAFTVGMKEALRLGADIIVNLDADNQYSSASIGALIKPILAREAEVVLGARDFDAMAEFSELKRFFQRLGSRVVSVLCRASIPDAATGFRAFSRRAAQRLNVFTKYTYTLETLIHASRNEERIVSVPILTNPPLRKSRLFSHPIAYVARSAGALVRLVVLYNPLRTFGWISLFVAACGGVIFFCHFPTGFAIGLLGLAFLIFAVGLILDQISVNRRLLEKIQFQMLELEDERTSSR